MKHLLMIAIGCTSLASLIAAAPARSQTPKSSCPPPYVWVDVKKSPFKIDPRLIVNGKVKMSSAGSCSEGPPPGFKASPQYMDDFDRLKCDPKTGRCKRIPADPKSFPAGAKILPRRTNPPEIRIAPFTQSKRLRPPASLQQTSKDIRPHQQRSTFDGIFAPNDLRVVDNTKVKPWSPRTKIYSSYFSLGVGKQCSGTLVGTRHLLTAAHCIWEAVPDTDPPVLKFPDQIKPINSSSLHLGSRP